MSRNPQKKTRKPSREPVLLDRNRKPRGLRLPDGLRRRFTRRRVKWLLILLTVLAFLNWNTLFPPDKPLTERQARARAELHALQDQLGRFPTAYIAHAEQKDGTWYVWLQSMDPEKDPYGHGHYRILAMDGVSGKITIVQEGSGPLPR